MYDNPGFKWLDVVGDYLPNPAEVHCIVIVYQHMPQAFDCLPVNIRVAFDEFAGQLISRFSDTLQVICYRVTDQFVGYKMLAINNTRDESLDIID